VAQRIAPANTKVKIPQHNRL